VYLESRHHIGVPQQGLWINRDSPTSVTRREANTNRPNRAYDPPLLIPALILSEFMRRRSISHSAILVTIVFALLYLSQNLLLRSDESYFHQLSYINAASIYFNLVEYSRAMIGYWSSGVGVEVQIVMAAITGSFAALGYVVLVRKELSVGDVFVLMYVGLILLWPFYQGARFLLPTIPMFIMYMFSGVESLRLQRLPFHKDYFTVVILCLVGFSYLASYSERSFSDLSHGVEKKESIEMFDFIGQHTIKDSIIIFRKPRVLALFTGRKSSAYHVTEEPDRLWRYIRKIGATHIVVKHRGKDFPNDVKTLSKLVEQYREALDLAFENEEFRVYRIKSSKG